MAEELMDFIPGKACIADAGYASKDIASELKRFRRIATRYDKTVECFSGFLYLACAMQWLN